MVDDFGSFLEMLFVGRWNEFN